MHYCSNNSGRNAGDYREGVAVRKVNIWGDEGNNWVPCTLRIIFRFMPQA